MRVATSTAQSTLYFLSSDHLGSSSLTTDASGAFVARQLYDAWGNVRSGGGMPTDIGYVGKRLDATGLMFYGARYYSPMIGRFVSPDWVVPDPTQSRDLSRYAYAANSPLSFIDPNGHQTRPACGGVICSTGTGGPYIVATPAVQPLTVGTTQSASDVYISAGGYRSDDGVLLKYHSPYVLYDREEGVLGNTKIGSVATLETRQFEEHNLLTGELLDSGIQTKASGGVPFEVAGTGLNLGGGCKFGQSAGCGLQARGDIAGALQGSVELGQGDIHVMVGLVNPLPGLDKYGVGLGGRTGVGIKMGMGDSFITSYANYMTMGADEIGAQFAPKETLWTTEIVRGYFDPSGKWISGLDYLRNREWLRVYAIEGYEYPQEVP